MYHEITVREQKKKRRRLIISVAVVLLLLALGMVAARGVQRGAREQGAAALRESIMNAAVRCCAIEGSYPLTLKHLEDDYGLRINHHDFVITYEAYASNLAPTVVVVPR